MTQNTGNLLYLWFVIGIQRKYFNDKGNGSRMWVYEFYGMIVNIFFMSGNVSIHLYRIANTSPLIIIGLLQFQITKQFSSIYEKQQG